MTRRQTGKTPEIKIQSSLLTNCTRKEPKRPETSQNDLKHQPKRPKTPAETIKNCETTCNDPELQNWANL